MNSKEYVFEKVSDNTIEVYRKEKVKDYRAQISDYIEEGIITYGADFILITIDNTEVGYFCLGNQKEYANKILEFFVINEYKCHAPQIIREIIKHFECDGWFVNTQDSFSLSLLIELDLPYTINGFIFKYGRCVLPVLDNETNSLLEVARVEEVERIYELVVLDDFYTGGDIESLREKIRNKELYVLKTSGRIIGVGFISILKRTPRYADVAMLIVPEERKKGFGVLIQKMLIGLCEEYNLIPTACCDVDNIISRKTLQHAGYYLDGCMLIADCNR